MLTQEKLQGVTSPDCPLSLVLFDEIEKASPALSTLLLGILDRATLTLGDNTLVNFEQSLIFLTSNLGAREMMREMRPDLGFQGTHVRSSRTWPTSWKTSASPPSAGASRRSSSTGSTSSSPISRSIPTR